MVANAIRAPRQRPVTAVSQPGQLIMPARRSWGRWLVSENNDADRGYRRSGDTMGGVEPIAFQYASTGYEWATFAVTSADALIVRMLNGDQLAGIDNLVVAVRGMPSVVTIPWTGSQYGSGGGGAPGWHAALAPFVDGQPLLFWLRDGG